MQQNNLYVDLGGGSVFQYANRDPYQSMGYILTTPEGKTVMIDGGRNEGADAAYMHDQIMKRGGKVDLWIITHAHFDHFGALSYLLRTMDKLDFEIYDLRFDFPPLEWLGQVEGGNPLPHAKGFLEGLEKHGITHGSISTGDLIECGGLRIEILHDGKDYAEYSCVNDTSVVMRISFPKRDVLFLADLGQRSAAKLGRTCDSKKLRCDIVQMAHHGQNGADKAFYEIVLPKIALYTAPDWLWENNTGKGRDTGPYKTLRTREWLDELGVLLSCPHAYGDFLLE